jgi:hypothetical protein
MTNRAKISHKNSNMFVVVKCNPLSIAALIQNDTKQAVAHHIQKQMS